MQNRFLRHIACLVSLVLLVSVCLVDAGAQTRRRRKSRRVARPVVRPVVTNPQIAAPGEEQDPGADGEKIISTADQSGTEGETATETPPAKKTTAKPVREADMQQTIRQLSNQVDRLNDKLTELQRNDRTLIDMERLTRAEQRAENLRAQQVDVESKLADLDAKRELVEYQLRPENIERAAGYGTVHPEEVREARRRQLENERTRLLAQIRILETSRDRLAQSQVTADAEVDALRRRIELQPATQNTSEAPAADTRRPRPE